MPGNEADLLLISSRRVHPSVVSFKSTM